MINSKKIAVLGGGSGAHAMAADLSMKGYKVNMCELPEFKDEINTIFERQTIDLIDAWGEKHSVKLNMVTTDFANAIKGVSYIMLTIPAMGTKRFVDVIAPYLEDGQTLVKWSANFSALAITKMLKDKGIKKTITIAESHTLPWGCRIVSPGIVQIMVWATQLMFATLPAKNSNKIMAEIQKMYPVVPGANVLATTLNNLNPIVHPVGTVMNAGWVDSAGKNFYLYRDGNTLSISRGIKRTFEEVSKVANSLGIKMLEYPEEDFWRKSSIMGTYFRATFDKEGQTDKISGPSTVKSRYITEDIPYGLSPISKLARMLNISLPFIDSIIEFASIINQTNYRKESLSLEDLGIAGMNKQELKTALKEGFNRI